MVFWVRQIGFKFDLNSSAQKLTKRTILSELLSIFDPLGLLSPIVIYNKILMQEIWRQKIDWDDEVSTDIKQKWMEFRNQLPIVERLRAPRWLGCRPFDRVDLIGFSDASESAFGACVYLKVYDETEVKVNLVAAKTRVAPLKRVTLPRLELCAAELLAKLMCRVKLALKLEVREAHYYSDSKIALAWIKSEPSRWKTFVANRVARIQEMSDSESWHYVNTKANPADFASRGLLPEQLVNNELWWFGPSILLNDETYDHNSFETDLEGKRPKAVAMNAQLDVSIIDKFSSLNRAVRTVAFCRRYVNQLRKKRGLSAVLLTDDLKKEVGGVALDAAELLEAKLLIIKLYQNKYFSGDIQSLLRGGELSKRSSLLSLSPFLDSHGVLRVGGRLQNSDFSYNKKHPIIIPYGSKLMELIIDEAHKKTMHGGNQLTLAQTRHEYWIIAAKRAVKKYINGCVICHRFRRSDTHQLMGNLPGARTKVVSKAFTYTGTDLCGPIQLKIMRARGTVTQKGYIVIFICLSTRAIHIEIVTDLTAEAFIAAFRRMVGRRGNVLHLYSDNGTNFIGAKNILQIEGEQALLDYNTHVKRELANLNTIFHFNPSASPWMGGIWERGVGSIKYHLKRTIGGRILSYEEMSTVLTQIEAILNSRPISPLSENPDDLEALTPGHFLVGSALLAPIEPNLMKVKENRLSDWQLCVRLKQEFWQNWASEYLSQLQLRSKWRHVQENLSVGDMVLVKEDNMAPLQWPLGRVTKTFPGKDGLVRVVEVQMRGKIYKRPIVKLAPLPKRTHELEEEIDGALLLEENEKVAVSDKNMASSKGAFCAISIDDDSYSLKSSRIANKRAVSGCKKSFVGFVGTICTVALCMFFCTTPVAGQNFSVIQFSSQAVAYIEPCKNVSEIVGYWNLAVHTNLDAYYREIDHLHESLRGVEVRCNQRKNSSICAQVISNYWKRLNTITEYEKAIKNKMVSRNKRGVGAMLIGSIIGVAGSMAYNWVSGLFAANDQGALLEKQTSVIDLATQKILSLEDSVLMTSAHQNEEIWATIWLTSAFEQVAKAQERILKMLTQEKIEINDIPVDVLMNQVKLISNSSSKFRLFGENLLDQAMNIYKMAEIAEIITVKNSIIALIKIPLISRDVFECSQIFPIPFVRSDTTEVISVLRRFVLFNGKKNQTCFKDSYEMNQCFIVNENMFCELEKVFEVQDDEFCELNIVLNKQLDKCITYKYGHSDFLEKVKLNTWLYSLNNTIAHIFCENKISSVVLHGSGLLQIHPKCNANINNVHINSMHYEMENVYLQTEHWYSISLDAAGSPLSSTNDLELAMNELRNETALHRFFHVHHAFILYTFIGWVLFCCSVLFLRKCRNKTK